MSSAASPNRRFNNKDTEFTKYRLAFLVDMSLRANLIPDQWSSIGACIGADFSQANHKVAGLGWDRRKRSLASLQENEGLLVSYLYLIVIVHIATSKPRFCGLNLCRPNCTLSGPIYYNLHTHQYGATEYSMALCIPEKHSDDGNLLCKKNTGPASVPRGSLFAWLTL